MRERIHMYACHAHCVCVEILTVVHQRQYIEWHVCQVETCVIYITDICLCECVIAVQHTANSCATHQFLMCSQIVVSLFHFNSSSHRFCMCIYVFALLLQLILQYTYIWSHAYSFQPTNETRRECALISRWYCHTNTYTDRHTQLYIQSRKYIARVQHDIVRANTQ